MRHGRAHPPGPPAGSGRRRDRRLRRSRAPAARALADRASLGAGGGSGAQQPSPPLPTIVSCSAQIAPDALAIFTPHLSHYRLTMDALQAGCHVFIEKPLSTNVQEAADIVSLARAAISRSESAINFAFVPA